VVREIFHLKNVVVMQGDAAFASKLQLCLLLGRISKRPVLKYGFIEIAPKSSYCIPCKTLRYTCLQV